DIFDKDSDYILENFNSYIGDIFNFNMSVIFLCCSIILYLINCLKVDKLIMDLEEPSYQTSKGGSIKIGKVLRGNSKKMLNSDFTSTKFTFFYYY
ncbi:unnamed protein product, partial [marine sediment metagenome]